MNSLIEKLTDSRKTGARIEGIVRRTSLRPWRVIVPAAAVLLLGSCDTTNYAAKQEAQTPSAPVAPTQIVTGSKLSLRTPLSLPEGGAPLLFQRNAIVKQSELADNAPFCRFTAASSGVPRTLKPTTFTVRNIDYDEKQSASGPRPVSVTHYRLNLAPNQPGYVLSCQWPEGAPAGAFVTSDDVQGTVSAFFTIDPLR